MKINQERLVDTFIKLVKINSESGEEKKIIKYLKNELQKLGFKIYIDKVGNLIARNSEKPKLLLSAHTDTVKPGKNIRPVITKSGIIKSDGATILGADDKAGVVTILEVLKMIKREKIKAGLEIVFTISEEPGLVGSRGLELEALKSKNALNLDSKPGEIIAGEPSIMQFDIEIIGKSAHAGVHPEKGINAIEVVSKAISKIKWGRIDHETTTNIGTINGGLARNIVADKVQIQAEVRSRNFNKFRKYSKMITNIFKDISKKYKSKIKIKNVQVAKAYKFKKSDKLIAVLIRSCKKNNIIVKFEPSCGATDANVLNSRGIKCITTGGSNGDNIHSTKEMIKIKDLIKGVKIIYNAVLELSKGE